MLTKFRFFFKDKSIDCDSDVPKGEEIIINETLCEDHIVADVGQSNYVCGWVLTKCLQSVVKNCKVCKASLIATKDDKNNSYIKLREYNINKKWLCYPSDELTKCFQNIQSIVTSTLSKNV